VKAGDILVGKVTPKGETQLTPEEKLLRAIFGEKASDVKDTSLRVPPGMDGTVIDVRVFTRDGVDKDSRALVHREGELAPSARTSTTSCASSRTTLRARRAHAHRQGRRRRPERLKAARRSPSEYLDEVPREKWFEIRLRRRGREPAARGAAPPRAKLRKASSALRGQEGQDHRGRRPRPGVLKMVKVYLAVKRRVQPGDKMAGRHGNKGVISTIVPVEDMPYMTTARRSTSC
jgi:DNA-directed RNA polymerase subunit beta